MIKLRDLENKDKELLVEYLNNPNVVKYLSSNIPQPYSLEDATWWVDTGSKQSAIVKAIGQDDEIVGVIGAYIQKDEYAHSAEIGYWVAERFWNKGIATEAVIQFTQFMFSQTNVSRLFNPVSKPNTASIRVMKKAGYQLEGELKSSVFQCGQYLNELYFAICNNKIKTNKGRAKT